MHSRTTIRTLGISLVLAVVSTGATCSPKKVCHAIQDWNFRSAEMLVAVWDVWSDFYGDQSIEIGDAVIDDHKDQLTPDIIDELTAVIAKDMLETCSGVCELWFTEDELALLEALADNAPVSPDPLVAKMYEEYEDGMAPYDAISKHMANVLDYTAESMEIVEHASISCQGFSDKDLRLALTEIGRGLLEVMDILVEAGIEIPQMVLEAKEMADDILEAIGEGNGI